MMLSTSRSTGIVRATNCLVARCVSIARTKTSLTDYLICRDRYGRAKQFLPT
jgi:hypothetical protein